jgi:hypothetical protein
MDFMNRSRQLLFSCILACLFMLIAAGGATASPDPSLVLHWKLDGDFRDISGNNNHGAATGNISCAAGGAIEDLRIFGRALSPIEISQFYNQR